MVGESHEMQRNFTPQGKPQDPGALDRKLYVAALGELKVLAPGLTSQMQHLAELSKLVTEAINLGGHTTGELSSMIRQARLALGIVKRP